MKKHRLPAILLTLVLTLWALPAGAADQADPYTDVPQDAWYAEAAAWCAEAGLMDGVGNGLFDPQGETSRAMVVTVLHRLSGNPARVKAEAFSDVPADAWYARSVGWAAIQGITEGREDGTFGPLESVSRQDLAVFLWRSMGSPAAAGEASFSDEGEISPYALEAVRWACAAGIVNGMGDGTFAPKAGATRAQLANILMKLSRTLLAPSLLETGIFPCGIAKGEEGILVTDTCNKCIWLMTAEGVTRYSGGESPEDLDGVPVGGYLDGANDACLFLQPWAIAPYLGGWAVADRDNNALRHISESGVQTINAAAGEDGLETSEAGVTWERPMGLAADEEGNLYVSDTGRGCIRVISTEGRVTTLVKGLDEPTGLCWAAGSLYAAESGAQRILKITDGVVTVLAGSGQEGYLDGPAAEARFSSPMGLAVDDQGRVYVADAVNGAVRRIADGTVSTMMIAQADTPQHVPLFPVGLLAEEGSLYICDNFTGRLMCISLG